MKGYQKKREIKKAKQEIEGCKSCLKLDLAPNARKQYKDLLKTYQDRLKKLLP